MHLSLEEFTVFGIDLLNLLLKARFLFLVVSLVTGPDNSLLIIECLFFSLTTALLLHLLVKNLPHLILFLFVPGHSSLILHAESFLALHFVLCEVSIFICPLFLLGGDDS